ncbi:MAG TPA: class I SAM-dependent methyltransferase [Gemmatimonadales bacterium]|nr:class I SAM-dependent methyltransferase [Gemmatimonadales bacterium]
MPDPRPLESSFRDPSGFMFTRSGVLYRQVNRVFANEFEAVTGTGLYDELSRQGLLIPHQPVALSLAATDEAAAVLQPERVGFISYPYEWCFGQLRDAALLTLDIQERALVRGVTLRDASAYNVQFQGGRPIFIDTLSFEPRREGAPWAAYRQFCEHFLIPLALMSRVDVRLASLLRAHLEGIPLDLGARLLGSRTWRSLGLLFHVRLHAMAQRRYRDVAPPAPSARRAVTIQSLIGLVHSLRGLVTRFTWQPQGTEWADYTSDNNYTAQSTASKRELVTAMLRGRGIRTVWDLGANTGDYSRAARAEAEQVIAFDVDPAAVERNYRRVRAENEARILPLVMDLTNPSPALGWAHRERLSLEQRGPADALLALALVHHLAIGHNLPLERIAETFARLGRHLIIEFVPKQDSQVQRMLRSRPDIFPHYTREGFEAAFGTCFRIEDAQPVAGSERHLYLMTSVGGA